MNLWTLFFKSPEFLLFIVFFVTFSIIYSIFAMQVVKKIGGETHMAKLFKVKFSKQTVTEREVNVIAETPEEATAKAAIEEGEAVSAVEDQGEVVV